MLDEDGGCHLLRADRCGKKMKSLEMSEIGTLICFGALEACKGADATI